MKKFYYINTNGYDCIVSADEEANIVKIFADNAFPDEWLNAVSNLRNTADSYDLRGNALFQDILNSVEDDSSWAELDVNADEKSIYAAFNVGEDNGAEVMGMITAEI